MSTEVTNRQIYVLLVLPVLEVFLNASIAQKYHDQKLLSGVSCFLRTLNQLNSSFYSQKMEKLRDKNYKMCKLRCLSLTPCSLQ